MNEATVQDGSRGSPANTDWASMGHISCKTWRIWPRNDMRCWLLGKLHRISVSWIQRGHYWGYGYPKIIKKIPCWVRMVVLEGVFLQFFAQAKPAWFQKSPEVPSSHLLQGHKGWDDGFWRLDPPGRVAPAAGSFGVVMSGCSRTPAKSFAHIRCCSTGFQDVFLD